MLEYFSIERRLVRAFVAAILGVAVLSGHSQLAWAAAAVEDEDEDEELSEVVVTGTRIQLPNVQSANPITSITAEEMRDLGMVNVADALLTLVPQNISTYQPTMTGDNQSGTGGGGMVGLDRGSYFIGSTIANLRGMDPAFGTRTLTLVDGRRVVSSSGQADVVDLNIIPSNLLQRMDVVTGGASATYGSGAMAGVVNMVLNNRLTGVNLDMDYGANFAGDGGSPHVALSGGLPLFDGRGHILLSGEWQKQSAIWDCASARDWCGQSRHLFVNADGSTQDVMGVLSPLPGYGDTDGDGLGNFPARFQMFEQRRQQHADTATVRHANALLTQGYRFNAAGDDVEEYLYGFRGGSGGNGLGGDGPLTTERVTMRPSSERRNLFTNFEYNITERTTAYLQGNYAQTEGLNRNGWTSGDYCVKFNSPGTTVSPGGAARPGDIMTYGASAFTPAVYTATGETYPPATRHAFFSPTAPDQGFNVHMMEHLGIGLSGIGNSEALNPPWWVPVLGPFGVGESPPTHNFNGNATGTWVRLTLTTPQQGQTEVWVLETLHLGPTFPEYVDFGSPAGLPQLGRNANAFLYGLSEEALYQVQRGAGTGGTYYALQNPTTGAALTGFSNSISGGIATGPGALFGLTPCEGNSAIRKVWDPQISRWTEQEGETMRVVAGIKGRFGSDWRWDGYYQYGGTDSSSTQHNVATSLRLNMAMESVVDDRQFLADGVTANPTYGRPVCRFIRDGIPVLDWEAVPLSEPEALQALVDGCVPINPFGSTPYLSSWVSPLDSSIVISPEERRQMQEDALAFSFVNTTSRGATRQHIASLSTNGTIWGGYGAGPLTGAFGLEVREDTTNNKGTVGSPTIYERADLANVWSDAFGGKNRVTEGYAEFDLPVISGVEGLNLWSVNGALRYASYHNKGGAGTTGDSATQNIMNWKVSTIFEPFDFVRLRLTRSRDLRAPGFQDLFELRPSQPDQFSGSNPWRERTAFSTENRQERWGQVRVGNPDLKVETSDTLTVGLVLSPGGFAQGMRVTADYFTIGVKDAFVVPFAAGDPVRACWEASGNFDPEYSEDGEVVVPGVNGEFLENHASCREITFATNEDGSRNLQDILSYNSARPENALPIRRRGIDVSVSYPFPLNRVFEALPGSVSLTVRVSRALEASGTQVNSALTNTAENCAARGGTIVNPTQTPDGFADSTVNCHIPVDFVGQIRSSVFVPGVSASPKWSGNIISTYRMGSVTASLSARYIGAARIDNTWCDADQFAAGSCTSYMNEAGQFLNGSIDRNWVKPYMNLSLNGSYDIKVANLRRFNVYGSINNLMDKTPPFTGGGQSGATANYHDTMGRAYRVGVRMQF